MRTSTFREITKHLGVDNVDVASIFGVTRQGVGYWYREGDHAVSQEVADWLRGQEEVYANAVWFFLSLFGWPTDAARKVVLRRVPKDSPDSVKFGDAARSFLGSVSLPWERASAIPSPRTVQDFHFFFPPLRQLSAASIGPYGQAVSFVAAISLWQTSPCSVADYKERLRRGGLDDSMSNRMAFLSSLMTEGGERP